MSPWSSPRSSGCRATDWIIEPKMLPMPAPAPAAPAPMPSASAIALPACTIGAFLTDAARRNASTWFSLVFGLDRRADVDGRESGEDERLDRHDDHDFEDVEEEGGRKAQGPPGPAVDDEQEADHGQDQDVAREHVRVEPDGEADQAHELREDLDRDDQRQDRARHLGDPRAEVADDAVEPDPLDVREDERQEGERERDRDLGSRRVDAPDGNVVVRLARERQRNEADQVDDEDEEHQRRDVREPERDRLVRQAGLGDLRLRDVVERLAEGLPAIGNLPEVEPHEQDPEQARERGADEQETTALLI